jgi:hypothetical protein
MPLFSAKSEIFERVQEKCKRLKLLALNEWMTKLGLLFHTSIHRRVQPTRGSVTGSRNQIRASINAIAANSLLVPNFRPARAPRFRPRIKLMSASEWHTGSAFHQIEYSLRVVKPLRDSFHLTGSGWEFNGAGNAAFDGRNCFRYIIHERGAQRGQRVWGLP